MIQPLVFLGPPGSGKGTQAKQLVANHGYTHLSTGTLLREEIKAGSDIGKQVGDLIDRGFLVPDELAFELVKKFMNTNPHGKILFDGYPRSLKQAELLDSFLESLDSSLKMVVYFDVDVESIAQRITGRLTCAGCGAVYHGVYNPPRVKGQCDECGRVGLTERADDTVEVLKQRIEVYKAETEELVRTYENRQLLQRINASQEIAVVSGEIDALIGKLSGS